jgi:hypothetical protein
VPTVQEVDHTDSSSYQPVDQFLLCFLFTLRGPEYLDQFAQIRRPRDIQQQRRERFRYGWHADVGVGWWALVVSVLSFCISLLTFWRNRVPRPRWVIEWDYGDNPDDDLITDSI